MGIKNYTTVISLRLPNETVFTLQRRVDGRRGRWESVGDYLQERIIYDTDRSHKRIERFNG